MNYLRKLDAELTEIEFSSSLEPEDKRKALAKLRSEYKHRTGSLDKVQETGMHLVQRSDSRDAERVEEKVKEFTDFLTDVVSRLENLVDTLKPEEVSEEDSDKLFGPLPPISVNTSIQVDTLKFERDSAAQADTLLTQSVMSVPDSGVSLHSSPPGPISPLTTASDRTRGATPLSESLGHSPQLRPDSISGDLLGRFVSGYEETERPKMELLKSQADANASQEELERDVLHNLGELNDNMEKLETMLAESNANQSERMDFQDLVRKEK